MTDVASLSRVDFGDIASGVGSGVVLNFHAESPVSESPLPARVIVAGQSVHSFVQSLNTDHVLRSTLDDLLPSGDGQKGFSANSTCRLNGVKTKVNVIGVSTEASRHVNPYRSDSLTKSLTSTFSDLVSEASKESGSVRVIACVPCTAAIASTVYSISRSLPLFTRRTDRGKDLAATTAVPIDVYFHVASGESVSASQLSSLAIVGQSIRMSQCLTDSPPNELNPTTYTAFIAKSVAAFNSTNGGVGKIEMKVIRGKELEEQGMGGIWSVGKGNTTDPPAMIILSFVPVGAVATPETPSVVLVGKGITYDTGGLALKQPVNMIGMKTDMTGSGSMFASFLAISKIGGLTDKSPLNCILCIAENSVGPDSFRNDDVIRLYSGLTVEVHNTDAEGRLCLGDGVAYAAKHLNPRLVLDMATLTGAQGIATGTQHGAIMAAFEEEEKELVAAGKISGDNAFPILFAPEFHKPLYKSEVADMRNITTPRTDAPSSLAGWFIYEHLTAGGYSGRWAHIDMAAPATFGNGKGTGYGVALICSYLRPDIL